MSPRELATLKFWNAAVFIRRAPDRSPAVARQVLAEAARCDFQPIRDRAVSILKGTNHDAEPARAE
jgi:hypothetical protein